MKKTFTTCLLLWLACIIPNAAMAFELPALPHVPFVDDLLQWGGKFKERFIKEGISSIGGSFGIQRDMTLSGGLQIAHPVFESMVGPRYLFRTEGNILGIVDTSILKTKEPTASLAIIGLTGRYIAKPNLIVGGYILGGTYAIAPRIYMTHLGLEVIWPRYGMFTINSVFNPFKLFNSKGSSYEKTLKLTIIKPRVFNVYTAFSFTKYPACKRQWAWNIIGCKFQLPVSKWNLRKRWTLGGDIVYSPIRDGGINIFAYIQFNILKNKPQNTFKDYLRMPIDQPAKLFHPYYKPDNLPYEWE